MLMEMVHVMCKYLGDMLWPWSFVQLVFDQYKIESHPKDFAVLLNFIDDIIKIKGRNM